MKTSNASISAWEQDPGSGNQPDGGLLIQVAAPQLNATSLATIIQNPASAPPAAVYNPGLPEFRYWAAAAALSRTSTFWSALLPGVSWQVGKVLPVDLDHGDDLNAFYDRVGLRFFHGTVGARTFFSGESPDVVCHEEGHAVLDSIKPQLWDAASLEISAFHESFADISALLSALQVASLRHGVLAETAGVLYRNSRLSRLAEQLGWAIRQGHPTLVDPDCLRNAVNSFFYRDPNTLPSNAPASNLSSEPHSFSRVFTSAFFEGLSNMFSLRAVQDEPNLLQVSTDMGTILIGGVRAASVVPTFYSQVAINMIQVAGSEFTEISYGDALKTSFIKHGIISPANAAVFAQAKMEIAVAPAQQDQTSELPKLSLSVSEYGLGVDAILVHSASEPKRFDIAGAALDIGSASTPSEDVAAKAFLEDLLRRDRLRPGVEDDKAQPPANFPVAKHKHTHKLVKEGNDVVLKRIRIDCGLSH
jgi:hypothetical protein